MATESITNPNSLALILFGALITFVSTNVIEYIKNRREKSDKTKNFRLFIKLEFAIIVKTLDKLQAGLTYGNFYDYSLLDRVKESIDNLEKVRNDVIYLSDPELKEKFIDVISDVSTYIASVRIIQQIVYDEQKKIAPQDTQVDKVSKKTKVKKKNQESPAPVTMQSIIETFNKRATQKTIDYVEIKRRLEELIKSLE